MDGNDKVLINVLCVSSIVKLKNKASSLIT